MAAVPTAGFPSPEGRPSVSLRQRRCGGSPSWKAWIPEIVITGVNISAYHAGDLRLASLLEELLGATRRARFRLSSLEPEAITGSLAAVLAHPRICPHFHIPVQSGSDRILSRMNRPYRVDRVCCRGAERAGGAR